MNRTLLPWDKCATTACLACPGMPVKNKYKKIIIIEPKGPFTIKCVIHAKMFLASANSPVR